MSSDIDDDQVLPETLQKLEIVPIHPQSQTACKTNNERNQNPFFSVSSTANGLNDRITKDLFGPTCRSCESNDYSSGGSGSNAHSSGTDVSNKSWRHRGSSVSQCIEHINKQIHFKHRDKEKTQVLSEKKVTILRDPILKSIGRSMYHNAHRIKTCCESKKCGDEHKMANAHLKTATNPAWFALKSCDATDGSEPLQANCTINKRGTELRANKTNECQQVLGTADANNVMIHRIQNWQLDDDSTVDFKSLVNECNHLSLSTQETAINATTELHKSQNFQIQQSNQIGADAPSTSTASIHATLNGAGTSAMNTSLSSNSSNSSSCSQQARMNSNNCDVTIDELASYIEFQLNLPKRMSSNVYEAMFS